MRSVLEELELIGIVPVIVIDKAEDAVPLAQALMKGGLPCAEVTFRTLAAKESIAAIAKSVPGMLVGAGTVLTVDQVKSAVDAGARFIVAPGLNPTVVEYCLKNSIPVTPGVATPSDVEAALGLGLSTVKFFPAEANGGVNFLKAMSAPYKNVRFIPTGGIDESNVLSYLKLPSVVACGGSWMVKNELIAQKKFDDIAALTTRAVQTILGFSLAHIGINNANEQEAKRSAEKLASLLGLPVKDGASSMFAGTQFEFVKQKAAGAHGHAAIATHFIHRAVAYLERNGFAFDHESKKEKEGKLIAIYLREEIAGFAFHLLQT